MIHLAQMLFEISMKYIQNIHHENGVNDKKLLLALSNLFPTKERPKIKVSIGSITYLQHDFVLSDNIIYREMMPTSYYQNSRVELHFPSKAIISESSKNISEEIFKFFNIFLPTTASLIKGTAFYNIINQIRPMVILDKKMNIKAYNKNFEREVYPKESGVANFSSWVEEDDVDKFNRAFKNALKGQISCIKLPHPLRKDETNELILSPLNPYGPAQTVVVIIALCRDQLDIQAKYNLTPCELFIADQIQQGRHSKEIAKITGRSVETIKWHCKQIRIKLSLTGSRRALRVLLKDYPPFIPHSQ